jgi:hypothetical protein
MTFLLSFVEIPHLFHKLIGWNKYTHMYARPAFLQKVKSAKTCQFSTSD